MEVWMRRVFWAGGLLIGIGGTLLFALLIHKRGLPHGGDRLWYAWPMATALLARFSWSSWRTACRETPDEWPGLLQLRLSDLLASSFLIGGMLTVLSAAFPRALLRVCVPISITGGIGFCLGLLISSRMGLAGWRRAYTYALGFSMRLLAMLILGIFVCAVALYFLGWRSPVELLGSASHTLYEDTKEITFVALFVGFPLVLLITGSVLCRVATGARSTHEDHTPAT